GKRKVCRVRYAEFPVADNGDFLVIEIYHFIGVFYDRGGVRCEEEFIFPDTHNEGATLSSGNQKVRIFRRKNNDGICTYYLCKGQSDCLFKRTSFVALDILDKMDKYFGIGVAFERVTFVNEVLLQSAVVFDNSIMDDREISGRRIMRVSIAVIGLAMRRPSGMAYANGTVKIFSFQKFLEFGYFSLFLVNIKPSVEESYSGAVIAPVFKTF